VEHNEKRKFMETTLLKKDTFGVDWFEEEATAPAFFSDFS
jgi:hypothetical protein